MKRFHGLNRAKGYGLRSMSIQAKLTALAVNLKRIAALQSSLNFIFNIQARKYPMKHKKSGLRYFCIHKKGYFFSGFGRFRDTIYFKRFRYMLTATHHPR
ncbi:hypothetical protein Gferi_21055 [Geosporobacter ferrireducens]|uniref:Uncharacterized protein n=1 Tax=Geosporobacter ferrireducens TaxID=1424294 RepID=A0A1D8GLZ1_9FIRM|nr:hypothetical protein Gferi_21055 [Geosporobacter ferrireducens]